VGSRVDTAANEVQDYGGTEGVPCPTWATIPWAEGHWLSVDDMLCCSVYCASRYMGLSERQAQLNRAEKTRMNMLDAGASEEEVEHDRKVVKNRLEQRERDLEEFGGSIIADIEKLTSPDGESHGLDLPDESSDAAGDEQEVFEEIVGGEN
jgi:hypothetical protein